MMGLTLRLLSSDYLSCRCPIPDRDTHGYFEFGRYNTNVSGFWVLYLSIRQCERIVRIRIHYVPSAAEPQPMKKKQILPRRSQRGYAATKTRNISRKDAKAQSWDRFRRGVWHTPWGGGVAIAWLQNLRRRRKF
jgi:hypothetical protein